MTDTIILTKEEARENLREELKDYRRGWYKFAFWYMALLVFPIVMAHGTFPRSAAILTIIVLILLIIAIACYPWYKRMSISDIKQKMIWDRRAAARGERERAAYLYINQIERKQK